MHEYNLYLSVDTNTKTQTQWFYFAVTNTEEGKEIKFNICNITNPCTLIKHGLSPCVFSEIDYEREGLSWVSGTYDVKITKNNLIMTYEGIEKEQKTCQCFYTFSFTHTFKHTNDRVYFSLYKPYSITHLYAFMAQIKLNLLIKPGASSKILEDYLSKSHIKEYMKKTSKIKEEPKKIKEPYRPTTAKYRKQNKLIQENYESKIFDSNCLKQSENESELAIQDIQIDSPHIYYRQEKLCCTNGGIPIELITITSPKYSRH